MTTDDAGLSAAWPGIRDEQTADVLGALSPTARRILKAAYRVLERDGHEGLSLRRIAQEAGETRSLILYHFENKAGLLATLVDSLWHDADVALMDEVERLGADPRGRLLALTGLHRRFAEDPGLYRTYFDLFPHVLRDTDTRARLTRTYRSYRRIGELCLAPGPAGSRGPLPLATMLLAIGEGIAVQALLTGDDGLVAAAFLVLERRVLHHLGIEEAPALPAVPAGPVTGGSKPAQPAAAPGIDAGAGSLRDLEDPAARLTPAGARVLRAAVALASEEGLGALSADALSRKSGEPSSSVLYYFGDKRGLVANVVAASDYDFSQVLQKASRPVVGRLSGPAVVAEVQQRIFARPGWMRLFLDVLPVVLRDDALRAQEATFLDSVLRSQDVFLRNGGTPAGESRLLSVLTLALTHGLAMQKLVDPRGTPVNAVIQTWGALLDQGPSAVAEPSGKT